MAANPDNVCLSHVVEAKVGADSRSDASASLQGGEGMDYPQDLLQNYNQLSERYRRTTNALASAAHDLKTPLAILNGYVELLQSEKLGPLNERQREVIGDMQSSGQRLQHFIQDFLSYTVLETGELRMQYEQGDVNACLSEVCRLWSHRFQEKGLALYFLANDKLVPFPFDSEVASDFEFAGERFQVHASGGTVWLHAGPTCGNVAEPQAGRGKRTPPSTTHYSNAVKVSVADTGRHST
jgi:signal transduction histidine kinase